MLSSWRTSTTADACNTARAASMRPNGMSIFVVRYHIPTVSVRRTMRRQKPAIMASEVPTTFRSRPRSPSPSDTVTKREMADETVFITSIAMVTTPPTAA